MSNSSSVADTTSLYCPKHHRMSLHIVIWKYYWQLFYMDFIQQRTIMYPCWSPQNYPICWRKSKLQGENSVLSSWILQPSKNLFHDGHPTFWCRSLCCKTVQTSRRIHHKQYITCYWYAKYCYETKILL